MAHGRPARWYARATSGTVPGWHDVPVVSERAHGKRRAYAYLAGEVIDDMVDLPSVGVGGADKRVGGQVAQVALVPQPRASRRDVVGRALAPHPDQHWQVLAAQSPPQRTCA
jgi:hypothetical protein